MMTTVFIAGSRKIVQLEELVKQRLDTIIFKSFKIILGDAPGADLLVQQYLFAKNYNHVEIFCMGGVCRHNVGNWPIRKILSPSLRRDFAYYATKDQVMGKEADYGFMIWDGMSRGTLRNIDQLVHQNKRVLVHMAHNNSFYTLQNTAELNEMLRVCLR